MPISCDYAYLLSQISHVLLVVELKTTLLQTLRIKSIGNKCQFETFGGA